MAVTLLFGYNTNTLGAAADRQRVMKTNFLHRSLEESEVRPGIQALDAVAEHLVVSNPAVENEYLRDWMENTLNFLRPVGHGVVVTLSEDNKVWRVSYPENAEVEGGVLSEGTVTITKTGGELVLIDVKVRVFELQD